MCAAPFHPQCWACRLKCCLSIAQSDPNEGNLGQPGAGDEASGHIKASRATSGVDSGAGELGRAVDWSSLVKSCVIGSIPSVALSFSVSQTCSKAKLATESSESMFDFDKKP